MVDAEKAKQPKVKKNKNSNLPDINLKSLIFGAAAYAFFPLVLLGHFILVMKQNPILKRSF